MRYEIVAKDLRRPPPPNTIPPLGRRRDLDTSRAVRAPSRFLDQPEINALLLYKRRGISKEFTEKQNMSL